MRALPGHDGLTASASKIRPAWALAALLLVNLPATTWAGSTPGAIPLTDPVAITNGDKTYQLAALPAPDLSKTEEAVRRTLEETRESLATLTGRESDTGKLAAAWGRLGELYHAHHVYIPADPAYANASTLDPGNPRWLYLRAWLAEQTTRSADAIRYYNRVLELDPGHEQARLRLALAYIDDNQTDSARPLLEEPFKTPGMEAAVDFALGRMALQERDYERAASLLERVLELQPHASRTFSPLGIAYRGLGDVEGARRALSQYGDGKPKIPDPVTDHLDALLTGERTQFHRGLVGIQEGRYDIAAKAFGDAAAADPDNINVRVSYARALYLDGRKAAGGAELHAALEKDPDHAMANFFYGLLLAGNGKRDEAIARFEKTLASEPEHAGAHHFLGMVLMETGDYEAAARHFEAAARATPSDDTARAMGAMAILRAGAPHTRAVALLEQAYEVEPNSTFFAYALAWLLAGSPDETVRDGPRALELAEALVEQQDGPGNAEVLAMALAETGQYEEAEALQSRVVTAALQGGRFDLAPRLQRCLESYRSRKGCYHIWPENDPVYDSPPLDPSGPFRDYPTTSPY
jgi:tetratricopeptide (TPR) repeat protein